MIVKRWDYSKRSYVNWEIPDKFNCPLISTKEQEKINCASCGKEIFFEAGYRSQEIHNKRGMPYTVCPECFQKELSNLKKYLEGIK